MMISFWEKGPKNDENDKVVEENKTEKLDDLVNTELSAANTLHDSDNHTPERKSSITKDLLDANEDEQNTVSATVEANTDIVKQDIIKLDQVQ